MDPYVIVTYMGNTYTTKVHGSAGKEPVRKQTFEIPLQSVNDEIDFVVKDKDVIGSEKVGSARIKGTSLRFNSGIRDWFTVLNHQRLTRGQLTGTW